MNHGEIINSDIYNKNNIYDLFVNYFNNPKMYKIKDVQHLSIYMCKTYCLLSRECRYIIVIDNKNEEKVMSYKRLSEILWVSLQTRTLSDNHDLQPHSYVSTKKSQLSCDIFFKDKNNNSVNYYCQKYPINIELLYTEKNNEYQKEGTLISAIETYQTIITFS